MQANTSPTSPQQLSVPAYLLDVKRLRDYGTRSCLLLLWRQASQHLPMLLRQTVQHALQVVAQVDAAGHRLCCLCHGCATNAWYARKGQEATQPYICWAVGQCQHAANMLMLMQSHSLLLPLLLRVLGCWPCFPTSWCCLAHNGLAAQSGRQHRRQAMRYRQGHLLASNGGGCLGCAVGCCRY